MAVQRDGRWLVATRSSHVAFEARPGWLRLSFWPEQLVSSSAAVAGLVLAEIANDWNELLWAESPNVEMVWKLLGGQAKTLGMDAFEAVARCEQYEAPARGIDRAVRS
ncbi:hypothetical protein [Nocardia ninae]|uniref:Uncharacterized protein n=1 Tax=Nocardia ninae NBRC 108245 TaxID=1210091 RepID=A0A511MNI0_9NOCA|nr:hypothetical protein [Nocardia ninae]GEM42164.1 hypothetical protein NN4_66830 [Nocardia ninae NBRC 108245]